MRLGLARAISAALALGSTCALACSGAAPPPRADLSENVGAQKDFEAIRDRWEHEEWSRVLALEPALEGYLGKHESDPSSRRVRAMRALVALERGNLPLAQSHADLLLKPGVEGTTTDMARVVVGSIVRRRGRAGDALRDLGALFNRVIDPPTRAVLNRELAIAALQSKQEAKAGVYLRALLKESGGPLRGFAEQESVPLLAQLPSDVLLELLREEVGADEPDRWFSAMLTERLADVVKRGQDPALARALLDIAAGLLGGNADAVARVAAKGAGVRLERNTIGLLLPLRSEELRRRGIEVAKGLALALDLPGGSTRLVVRDDQRDLAKIDESLALLNADGAAVLVAGFDTKEADLALAYAKRTGVPVLLLRPPGSPIPDGGAVFVLGEDLAATRSALVAGLVRAGKKRVALLVEERTTADLDAKVARSVVAEQPCGASLDFATTSRADGLVVDGGPSCADVGASAAGLSLAFGFDAVGSGPSQGVFATAGIYPVLGHAEIDPMFVRFRQAEGKDPSWWVGLGHDAGLLVKDAIQGLPPAEDQGAAAIAIRRRIVADAVARAEVRLWTTDAKGFEGARTIKRTIGTTSARIEAKSEPLAPKGKRDLKR